MYLNNIQLIVKYVILFIMYTKEICLRQIASLHFQLSIIIVDHIKYILETK